MTKGCITTDLENLSAEYDIKISHIQKRLFDGSYKQKSRQRMIETLASYKASRDKLKVILEHLDEIDSNYSEYLDSLTESYLYR